MFSQTPTELRLRRTRLSVDALEQRCVPAVTATFVSGNLHIVGDNYNNDITITGTGAGAYQVDGLTAGSHAYSGVNYVRVDTMSGTDKVTLNGGPVALTYGATITGAGALTVVNNQFNIGTPYGGFTVMGTGTGDVNVFVQAGTVLGCGFSVTTGAGNDSVVVGPTAVVWGPALLRLGDGTNYTNFTGALVDGALTIAGGTESDIVELTNTQVGPYHHGFLDLNLGGGTDYVLSSGLSVNGNGQIRSANGSLNVRLMNALFQGNLGVSAREVVTIVSNTTLASWLWVVTGPTDHWDDQDIVVIDSCRIGGDLRVQAGTDWQVLGVKDTFVGGNGSFSGQGGALFVATGSFFQGGLLVDYQLAPASSDTTIHLLQSTVQGALTILTGAGDDEITLSGDTIGQAMPFAVSTINTGGGDDEVDLSGSTFYCNALFDGGPGTDSLHMGGARFLVSPPVILNFENVG
jgi:hypothetical protein